MPHGGHSDCCLSSSDAELLNILTGPTPPKRRILPRRDAALDPLLIAAAAASGPHITRNHYAHDFFPGVTLPTAEGSWDWTKFTGEDASSSNTTKKTKLAYVSRQAPRRVRMQRGEIPHEGKENQRQAPPSTPLVAISTDNLPHGIATQRVSRRRRSSAAPSPTVEGKVLSTPLLRPDNPREQTAVTVKCMARTRIPTAHGPVFLHLYHNNKDNKEHLAIVVDPAQLDESNAEQLAPHIRSRSLDEVWSESETDMDRITRGAFIGKLSPTTQRASTPDSIANNSSSFDFRVPAPLIRLHSECFTGETVGSMRCDCGEQLDEAIRQISQPISLPPLPGQSSPTTIPGRGAVIYLRQEGRGIGLLSKIRAYNLQDLGHDTVTANLMLGHGADERGYEIAGAILRDLGMGPADSSKLHLNGNGVRVLTNNPDKVKALEAEGLKVVERVPMVPRSWQKRNAHLAVGPEYALGLSHMHLDDAKSFDKIAGATAIGGNAVYGEDLDKYLRTKVIRMGHMLPLWMEDPEQ
jgi:GTP cyclohydrolase II